MIYYERVKQVQEFMKNCMIKNRQYFDKNECIKTAYAFVEYQEALYYKLRDMFNHKIACKYLDAVVYFFINKTAYSGMIRYNASGEYNVPFGRYKNFNTKLIADKHYELLKRTDIYNQDYSEIFNMAGDDDFIFLDPPYDCVFSDYGNETYRNGFGEDEHRRLANDFVNLPCKALLAIGKTALTEELYGKYIVEEYDKSYAVNIRNRFKADAKHIIVTNYWRIKRISRKSICAVVLRIFCWKKTEIFMLFWIISVWSMHIMRVAAIMTGYFGMSMHAGSWN